MITKRVDILGVPVDVVDRERALSAVQQMMRSEGPHRVIAVNPEKVVNAQEDQLLLDQLRSASLLIPDGIGVVWAARLLGERTIGRVPGVELMEAICAMAAKTGTRLFLFGAKPEVNRRALAELRRRYPGIEIVGSHHGYVERDGMPALIESINDSRAEILFVALGSPKQEEWIEEFLPQLKVKVCQGVGGSFDVLAGTVRRAPTIFRAFSLEWLYRLLAQPSRAGRQRALPVFAVRVLGHKLGAWAYRSRGC